MSEIKWFNFKKNDSKTDIYCSNEKKLKLSSLAIMKELDLAWFNFFVKNTSNGGVLKKNTYAEDFNKVRLVHITSSFDEIVRTGKIFPSGGGLGSVIYCSPLHKENSVHNLFEQYLHFQLPKHTPKELTPLCIEISLERRDKDNLSSYGVDYTNFGELHCMVWKVLKRELMKPYIAEFENKISSQVMKLRDVFNVFIDYNLNSVSSKKLREYYNSIFIGTPSLRFILYEILAEYILLYQDNKKAVKYRDIGELYNLSHKKFIFDLCPSMLKRFNMREFFIKIEDIEEYFSKSDIFVEFNKDQFEWFLKWRMGFYIKKLCLRKIDSINSFDQLVSNYPRLVGQIIYRDFFDKNLFERVRSKIIYPMWKKDRIICPIYPILPKGEVGVNPCLDELGVKYKIYKAKYDSRRGKLILLKELNIKLNSELISKAKTTVR
jgi:hypothetical protein